MLGGAKRNRKGRALALRSLILAGLVVSTVASPLVAGEIVIQPMETMEIKALFGRVESRFVVPARSRIGGTLTVLDITEGSEAKAGQVIARIVDPKLESQLAAAEARISSAKSQLENAETELTRNEELLAKGATTIQRVDTVRTTVEVARNGVAEAEAARQVTATLIEDGNVLAPADGVLQFSGVETMEPTQLPPLREIGDLVQFDNAGGKPALLLQIPFDVGRALVSRTLAARMRTFITCLSGEIWKTLRNRRSNWLTERLTSAARSLISMGSA